MAAKEAPPNLPNGDADAPDVSILELGRFEEFDVVVTTQQPDQWIRFRGPVLDLGGSDE
jgi:hypothetical protein